jgi:hypothetical protein
VTVKVVAKAADNHTNETTFTTTITHQATTPLATTISGPTEVYLDNYNKCSTVTWTASSTGGTSGYTYSWYIGTGTTPVGTGSSYSKSYCSTNQTVNVKVVVKDSAGTTAQDTHTTYIYYEYIGPGGCLAPAGPGDGNATAVCP